MNVDRSRKRSRGWMSSGLLALVALAACNEVVFPDAPPDLHGISVPIPPPSLTAEPIQQVDVEGSLATDMPTPSTLVYLYETRSARGYFVLADDNGDFVIHDVLLDLTDNCMQVWSKEPGAEGQESQHTAFKASIAADDQSVDVAEWKSGCE